MRTALSLACVSGRSLRITNIRGKRSNPGLRRQHLVCVEAAREICGARVSGAELRSRELEFEPGAVRAGDYRFDIGSAGSTLLVAQTVLPALLRAGQSSRVTISGGTHNPWAPPFDFVAEVFLPTIGRMGFRAEAQIQRHGFYPAGGGQISLGVEPWTAQDEEPGGSRAAPTGAPSPHAGPVAYPMLDLTRPPGEIEWTGRIYDSMLPAQVIESERSLLRQAIPAVGRTEHRRVTDSPGPGNCIMVAGEWTEGGGPEPAAGGDRPGRRGKTILTAFGEKGKPARRVADELREQFARFVASGAAVDEHLADQVLIYMALCGAGRFATGGQSLHETTNMAVIEKFLPVKFTSQSTATGQVVSCTSA